MLKKTGSRRRRPGRIERMESSGIPDKDRGILCGPTPYCVMRENNVNSLFLDSELLYKIGHFFQRTIVFNSLHYVRTCFAVSIKVENICALV